MTVTAIAATPRRFGTSGPMVPRIVAGVVILALWEFIVRRFAPDFVATPSGIARAFPSVITSAPFLAAMAQTLLAVAEGLVISVVAGTVIGLAIGRSTLSDRVLRHYVSAFYAMPMLVMLPLFSLWFGYTGAARLATIVFAAIFSIIVSVGDGARSVPKDYLEVAHSFRAGGIGALFEIVLPASLPYFLAGLRIAAGRALIGAVVAEFFTAIGGLGYYILYNSRTYHENEAFVAVLFLAGFGVGCDVLINWATRRFMPWYRRDETVE
ncbi:MAG: ABC transporter permease [Alphaproteobacteria bacterium]|nr:ABC transporter permease [Alphaproteobacteria bacterium]